MKLLLALMVGLVLAGCNSPSVTPTPAAVATKASVVATATLVPPTATTVARPTNTPVPVTLPTLTPTPTRKLEINPTFFFISSDGKEVIGYPSLDKIEGAFRSYRYDEEGGAQIKVALDKPAKDVLVVQEGVPDLFYFSILTPWLEKSPKDRDINEVLGNIYYFRLKSSRVWVFPKETPLSILKESDKIKQSQGYLLYAPWLLGEKFRDMITPEKLVLTPKGEQPASRDFEQMVSDNNLLGLLMGEEDAKRFAYYNGQPLVKVGSFYGWTFPSRSDSTIGECSYTHLALAYNVNVGYDTPIQAGRVVFVNIKHVPDLLPHGTPLKDGQKGEWNCINRNRN